MMTRMSNAGLSIHCCHDTLVEYCWDYAGRVSFIRHEKPRHERATRLRCFKLLPDEAIRALPQPVVMADAARAKADAAQSKAIVAQSKAVAARSKAIAAVAKADAAWGDADRQAWHARWCGCKEWNGTELVFPVKPRR